MICSCLLYTSGQSPNSAGVSLRTFNRNFEGRSGTRDAGVYLVSPETAAASCLTGYFTDPTTLPSMAPVEMPQEFPINDNMIDLPASEDTYESVEILRGPNIKPLPQAKPLEDVFSPVSYTHLPALTNEEYHCIVQIQPFWDQ